MQRTRYTRQTVETSKLPSRGTFPDNRPTIYIQKHKNFRKEQNQGATAQPTDKNYTAKNYCANKTLKTDENCINTDIAFLHKNVVEKYPTHLATAY